MEKVVRPVEILIFLTHVHPLGSNSLSKALPLELGTLSTPRSALGDGGGQDRIFCSPGRGLAGGDGSGGSGGVERAGEAAAEGAAGRGGGHPGGPGALEHGEIARPADWRIEEEGGGTAVRCGVNRARGRKRERRSLFLFFNIFFTRSLSAGTRPLLFIVLAAL